MATPQKNPALKGLVLLDIKNAILYEQLYAILFEGKREACEIIFSDFDEFSYKLSINPATLNIVKLNVALKAAAEFKANGSIDLLERLFPGLSVQADANYDYAIQFDSEKYTKNTEFLDNLSKIKRHFMGGPLEKALISLSNGTVVPPSSYAYRMYETVYICPSASKITVVFMVDFQDVMDRVMGRIFLQEFVEAQRACRAGPTTFYSKDAPLELQSYNLQTKDISGYISFSLEKSTAGTNREKLIDMMTGFRSYLHYHIKCSKTYLQMRMRKRVAGWLQVLNRAVPEVDTEKKTAAGKTFVRK